MRGTVPCQLISNIIMASKDLHSRPFDPGAIAKLEVFQDYAEAWLPTFVMKQRTKICIFDFLLVRDMTLLAL